jgi:hypothetical protein
MMFWTEQVQQKHHFRKMRFQECLNAAFLDERFGPFLLTVFNDNATEHDYSQFCLPIEHSEPLIRMQIDGRDLEDPHFSQVEKLFQFVRGRKEKSQQQQSMVTLCRMQKHQCVLCGHVAANAKEFQEHLSNAFGGGADHDFSLTFVFRHFFGKINAFHTFYRKGLQSVQCIAVKESAAATAADSFEKTPDEKMVEIAHCAEQATLKKFFPLVYQKILERTGKSILDPTVHTRWLKDTIEKMIKNCF